MVEDNISEITQEKINLVSVRCLLQLLLRFNFHIILKIVLLVSAGTIHSSKLYQIRGTTSVIIDASTTQQTKPISHLGSGLSMQRDSLCDPLCFLIICDRIF